MVTPEEDIKISKIYTYSCAGTGGHSEKVVFYAPDEFTDVNGKKHKNGIPAIKMFGYLEEKNKRMYSFLR